MLALQARALETKVELLQRKAKSAEKIEWLENLNRDMESAFQEDFEDDGFDEVPDEVFGANGHRILARIYMYLVFAPCVPESC